MKIGIPTQPIVTGKWGQIWDALNEIAQKLLYSSQISFGNSLQRLIVGLIVLLDDFYEFISLNF